MEPKGIGVAARMRRWQIVALVLAAVLALGALASWWAWRGLPDQVARALGPSARVESIALGWSGVKVQGLALRGTPGRWPAEHELRARTVTIRPALASLWRPGWTIGTIDVEDATLVLLRTREGRLVVTPSLLAPASAGAPNAPTGGDAAKREPAPQITIDRLRLRHVTLEVHDASVVPRGAAPHRLRLTEVDGDVGPLALPALDRPITIDLQAAFDAGRRDGRVALSGRLTPATRDADLKLDAKRLDLVALQPYLLKSGEARVTAGTLDLALQARAKAQRLHAPGHLALRGLELQSGGGLVGTFAGVPRQAVLAALSRDGTLELDFTLEGRVDDPTFSINELFAARFAVGLADKLGVTLGGVVQGVGSVIKELFSR